MTPLEAHVTGTLNPDGSLTLDSAVSLPPGPVSVRVVEQVLSSLPSDDPFWNRLQAIWNIPLDPRLADGGASTLAEIARMREEWHQHQSGQDQTNPGANTGSSTVEGSTR